MFTIFAIPILRWLWKYVAKNTLLKFLNPCHLNRFFTFQGPENWMVYRAWWGNLPVMAKGDVSGVAGVNSFNAVHPVSTMFIRSPGMERIFRLTTLLILMRFSENCLSVGYRRSLPKQKWIFGEQNWSEHSESMVVHVELPVSYQRIQHLLLLKWKPIAWQIWHWAKCQTSTDWIAPGDLGTKHCRKSVLRKKLGKLKALVGETVAEAIRMR